MSARSPDGSPSSPAPRRESARRRPGCSPRQGWRCVLVARREDELQRLAAELGGQAEVEICDVADREAVAATTARILERHPAVDLLVNSAGILVRGSFVDAPLDEIERALVVNYLGCVWVTRGLLDGLREAARTSGRSHIATIASTAGAIVFTPAAPYSASKFAQVAFSRSLRASLRGTGVEVHTIMPGFVTTPGFPHPKIFSTPLGRPFVIGPERVAKKVLSAVERGKAELIVPWFPYGLGAMAQAVLPRTTARVLKQFDYPDTRNLRLRRGVTRHCGARCRCVVRWPSTPSPRGRGR